MWRFPDDIPSRIAWAIAMAGLVGFFIPFLLAFGIIPNRFLDRIELPNSLQSVRVTAPDGRVFVVSEPLGRVQRYGPSGFERSFAVDSRGGAMEAGMSATGNLLICSARAGHVLITYNPDGQEIGYRQPCEPSTAHHGQLPDTPSYVANAKVPRIADSWLAALAVPLWHPFSGWLMAACGGLYLEYRRRAAKPTG